MKNPFRANTKPIENDNRLSGKGPAFQTITGKLLYLLHPDPKDINIYDIATGLSNQCRYNGQLPKFYSVAQHSVIVAEQAEKLGKNRRDCLKALLHDSHEAYLGDIVTPLKLVLDNYRDIENSVDDAICTRFKIPKGMGDWLHDLDKLVLATEIRDLRPHGQIRVKSAERLRDPIPDLHIEAIPPTEAALLFLQKYLQYTKQ